MKKLFLFLTVMFTITHRASSTEPGFSFTSDPLLFRPLTANTFEPRVGLIWHADDNRLRLDIGNSIDLFQYTFDSPKQRLTIGSDFFTYTLLSGEKNFHFPVDAVDYLFGFNANYRDTLENGILSGRLRLAHISAHFVDGHFNGTTGTWKDGMNPRVYSREFFDLTVSFEPTEQFRGYAGAWYLWHVDPVTISKFIGYVGGEYHQPLLSFLDGYAAYQFTASGFRPSHDLQVGIKIGEWNGRGTKIFFIHHSGNNIHGEYHDQLDQYSGIGFNIDL